MARHLDLAALRSFVAVVDSGGVTKAAGLLHLTQSAVSMQVKRLEESLGRSLLTRVGRGVEPTCDGLELASLARRLLHLNDEIWQRMTTSAFEGSLRLGVPHDIVYPQTPWILRKFNEDHPRVQVKLVSEPSARLREMVEDGRCDVIVTTEDGVGSGGVTLSHRRLVWVGAPNGRAYLRRPVSVAYEKQCAFRPLVFEALDAVGLPWEWSVDTSNFDGMIATMAADLAVSALLEGTTPRALAEIDHGGSLPSLPSLRINLYVARGPNAELSERLGRLVREAYSENAAVAA